MPEQLADEILRERGLDALEKELGPALTLRFLASISRQTFDYQAWRESRFGKQTLEQVFSELSKSSKTQP